MGGKRPQKSFEEALEELERIADQLASGDVSLDEAIAGYEQAVKIYRVCLKRLEDASKRIEMLTEEDGQLRATTVDSPQNLAASENSNVEAEEP